MVAKNFRRFDEVNWFVNLDNNEYLFLLVKKASYSYDSIYMTGLVWISLCSSY